MTTAHAVAKLIIAGEHAVVYRRPAIAVPLPDIQATVQISTAHNGHGCIINSPDLSQRVTFGIDTDPLLDLINDLLTTWQLPVPDIDITITSDIPIASGMGSGAAVATAMVRAMALFLHCDINKDEVGAYVYRSEQRLHGTPSGIDNTVIAYDQPISFCRRPPLPDGTPQPAIIAPLQIASPITIVVGDVFDAIAAVTVAAQHALKNGNIELLGTLCTQNHSLLQAIGVSTPMLDKLVESAINAGAFGAKLSGAGGGGVMFAVTNTHNSSSVAVAMKLAGAARTFTTIIAPF
ncbi:MAG: mevalonate kinase [Chloroflexales bacterium]|nr:mevalonate kinase [Chloroflexales bacterium]